MRRECTVMAAALVFAAQSVTAQLWDPGLPGDDIGSFALTAGVVSPATTFSDDGSSFDQGTAFGASLSYWPYYHVGLRTHVLRGVTEGNHGDLAPCPPTPCSPVGYQEPVVWLYGLEATLRRPMGGQGFHWFPYLSAGVAGKSYRWSIDRPRVGYTSHGFTAGGGVELRAGATGPFGFIAEVRNYRTKFQTLDKSQDHSDFVFTAGITLNR